MKSTIIVDWPLFKANQWVQDFISERVGQARMVLLVPEPEKSDFIFPEDGQLSFVQEINWDAVIRNSGGLDNVVFKATALSVLQEASDLEIVIAIEGDPNINDMYREGGVLVTTESL